MADADPGRHGPAVPVPAARSGPPVDEGAPEVFRRARSGQGRSRPQLPRRRQRRGDRRRPGSGRRQQPRPVGAPERRPLLLGRGPQGRLRRLERQAEGRHLPGQAGQRGRQGGTRGRPGRSDRPPGRRRRRAGQAGRAVGQERPAVGHGQRVPGTAGHHGRLLRPSGWPTRRRRRRRARPLQAARPGRQRPDRPGHGRRRHRREARHPGRLLRHRRKANRLPRPLCPAPRRPGRDPAGAGEWGADGTRPGRAGRRRPEGRRGHCRQDLRRRLQPPAGLGALGRAGLDAGDDGHGAEPRPERRNGRGPGQAVRRPPLRLRQLPPLHHHVLQCGAGPGPRLFRRGAGRPQGSSGRLGRHRTDRRELGKGGRGLQGPGRARTGQALPAGSPGPAVGRRRRRVRKLDERPGEILSPHARHPRKLGHGRQRPVDGVRQYGRDLGHRRRLHPQPLDGREQAVRRVPDQRPGRGRGGRHPHAAVPDQGGPRGDGRNGSFDGRGHA
uniref:LigA n=1 Tax=Parastrongyloides trichosuri TaxID=131310 RepID=A0A0N4ZZV6_PARTI